MSRPSVLQIGTEVSPAKPMSAMTPARPVVVEMTRMNEISWIDINLTRLDVNLQAFRQILARPVNPAASQAGLKPPRQPMICGVVKADAYGLGAANIAQRLVARGVDMLAVYSPAQAADLLRVSMNCPILVLSPMRELLRTDPLYRAAVTGRLHLAVHDLEQIDQILKIGTTFGCTMPVHLYLDTGMARSGLNEEQFTQALQKIAGVRYLKLAGIYSHLASAEDTGGYAQQQLDRFDGMIARHADGIPPDTITHIANTFATCRDRQYHREMVRVGLGLYGYGPDLLEGGQVISEVSELQPIVRWRSRINHIQRYPAGSMVGYNSTYTCPRDSVLGVVPVGYGDGYPLALSGKSVVAISDMQLAGRSVVAPVRGRVNMDQMVIDLTDIPDVTPGTMVDLISDDPASPCALPRLAKLANAHCYELLCRLSPRLARMPIYK